MVVTGKHFARAPIVACAILLAISAMSSQPSYAFIGGLINKIKNVVTAPGRVISNISKGNFEGAFSDVVSTVANVKQFIGAVGGNPADIVALLSTNPELKKIVPPGMRNAVVQAIQGNDGGATKALLTAAKQLESANELNSKQLAVLESMANRQADHIDDLIVLNNEQRKDFFRAMDKQLELIKKQGDDYVALTGKLFEAALNFARTIRVLSKDNRAVMLAMLKQHGLEKKEMVKFMKSLERQTKKMIAKYQGDKEEAEAQLKAYIQAVNILLSNNYQCTARITTNLQIDSLCVTSPQAAICQSRRASSDLNCWK